MPLGAGIHVAGAQAAGGLAASRCSSQVSPWSARSVGDTGHGDRVRDDGG